MGQIGSRVFYTLTKELRNFNVENRAHRVIAKEKPMPAPRYPADEKEMDRIAREHPEVLAEQANKNADLNSRLKQVFVTSQNPEHTIKQSASATRPLPSSRISPDMPEFGFREPARIAEGKVSLKQAIQFIGDYQDDPKKWSKENIASQYKIDPQVVENILVHFKTFQIRMPEKSVGKKKLEATPRQQLT